ncbi:MAG: hypothetical protein ACQSGP_02150 [Frankia sp.]
MAGAYNISMSWDRSGAWRWWALAAGLVGLGVLWWLTPDLYIHTKATDGRAGAIATTRTGILTVAAGLIAFVGVTMTLA